MSEAARVRRLAILQLRILAATSTLIRTFLCVAPSSPRHGRPRSREQRLVVASSHPRYTAPPHQLIQIPHRRCQSHHIATLGPGVLDRGRHSARRCAGVAIVAERPILARRRAEGHRHHNGVGGYLRVLARRSAQGMREMQLASSDMLRRHQRVSRLQTHVMWLGSG